MTLEFSTLPDFENPINEDRTKYINMISDGDPHFFIFIEKRDGQFVPLDVKNKREEMTNMVTIETMTLPMLERLKEIYQKFNDTKNNTSMYKMKNHFETLRMASGGSIHSKPKLKLRMKKVINY